MNVDNILAQVSRSEFIRIAQLFALQNLSCAEKYLRVMVVRDEPERQDMLNSHMPEQDETMVVTLKNIGQVSNLRRESDISFSDSVLAVLFYQGLAAFNSLADCISELKYIHDQEYRRIVKMLDEEKELHVNTSANCNAELKKNADFISTLQNVIKEKDLQINSLRLSFKTKEAKKAVTQLVRDHAALEKKLNIVESERDALLKVEKKRF